MVTCEKCGQDAGPTWPALRLRGPGGEVTIHFAPCWIDVDPRARDAMIFAAHGDLPLIGVGG